MNTNTFEIHEKAEWDALLARLKEADGLLREAEWDSVSYDEDGESHAACPWCGQIENNGHKVDCRYAAYLARAATPKEGTP